MELKIEQAAKRYNISQSTIRRNHTIIESRGGFSHRSKGGSDRNEYRSEVLDELAREGVLGYKAVKRMRSIDENQT